MQFGRPDPRPALVLASVFVGRGGVEPAPVNANIDEILVSKSDRSPLEEYVTCY